VLLDQATLCSVEVCCTMVFISSSFEYLQWCLFLVLLSIDRKNVHVSIVAIFDCSNPSVNSVSNTVSPCSFMVSGALFVQMCVCM